MNYHTGQVNSYAELLSELTEKMALKGWVASQGIYSKNGIYVQLSASLANTGNSGLSIKMGTGQSGSNLTGYQAQSGARLGRPSAHGSFMDVAWPATFHIFINEQPEEVYVVLNFSVDRFYWMAFGKSDIPGLSGTGNWYAACGTPTYDGSWQGGYLITPTNGLTSQNYSSGPWWVYESESAVAYSSHSINTGLDGIEWSAGKGGTTLGACGAPYGLASLPLGPAPWNLEAPLVPISVFSMRPESKLSLVLQVRHARYVRIENYQPGQVITLGHEQWKVFPFGRKNADSPTNGSGNHTGAFGWAIRYEE
ncbi:hypothetical protein [Comamonas aquatica]|uniref:hypothetical protein n=1 Tax=Comamonas aquatica TaxID=225991 RepID=UPI0024496B7A|nr:hypothetical protein [Comamonas aquatica]MDH0494243.1 hypothetical protein [Comamonas aquatica]